MSALPSPLSCMLFLLLHLLAFADPPADDAADAAATPADTCVPQTLSTMPVNNTWDVLTAPEDSDAGRRATMQAAGELLGEWTLHVSGVDIDGPLLVQIAQTDPEEPFLRAVREGIRRPVDLDDFLLFLDDVLALGQSGRRGEHLYLLAGRARKTGLMLHPDDIFRDDRPHTYPWNTDILHIDEPQPQTSYPPAKDGDPLGPEWTMRFRNPETEAEMWAAITEVEPQSTYASRWASLLKQIGLQGGETYVFTTVRRRHRGYLMWGAFVMAGATSEAQVEEIATMLDSRNREWGLDVPIAWRHPDGWEATVEKGREMKETYDVVYATEKGARWSNHYGGGAIDIVAFDLPRELTLHAPDGEITTFDLSDPSDPRDLNLSPQLIDWVEAHWGVGKLRSDYPHWDDREE